MTRPHRTPFIGEQRSVHSKHGFSILHRCAFGVGKKMDEERERERASERKWEREAETKGDRRKRENLGEIKIRTGLSI